MKNTFKKNEKKEASKGYPSLPSPEAAQTIVFFFQKFKENVQKTDFGHPRKEKETEKRKRKKWKNMRKKRVAKRQTTEECKLLPRTLGGALECVVFLGAKCLFWM